MGRLHLFEFHDQSWCPAALRNAATGYLRLVVEKTGQAAPLAPALRRALERAGSSRILDLCSGSAGPVVPVVREVAGSGFEVRACLTDLYPNVEAFERESRSSGGLIEFEPKSIDATRVPRDAPGFRTLFNSFHHFRPDTARRILRDAVEARAPIGIFELVERSPASIMGMLFTPIPVLLLMPLVRPFRWTNLLFTYLIPLIPLLVVWDGIVSCLRVYSVEELNEMVAGLEAQEYDWEAGRIPLGRMPVSATYLLGIPRP